MWISLLKAQECYIEQVTERIVSQIKMREENFIGQFLDNLDVNTKAYNALLFILGVLIALTLFVNQKIRTERQSELIPKTESTIIHPNLN